MDRTDPAERLASLIERMRTASTQMYNGRQLKTLPLYAALPLVAKNCGYDSYLEFQNSYVSLIRNIRAELEVLPFNKPKAKENAIYKLTKLEELHLPENFPKTLGDVFKEQFGWVYVEVLDDLSDRIQRDGRAEASASDLREALIAADEVREAVDACEGVSLRAKRLIRHHLEHLRDVIEHYDEFGESDFWIHYKQLFASFAELVATTAELRDEKNGSQLLGRLLARIHSTSSLAANAVTLAQPIFKALQ